MRTGALPNLGPTTERMLREVGVETADDLREIGGAMAYRLLRYRYGPRVTRSALWALAGALEGRHWLSFSDAEKAALEAEAAAELVVEPTLR